MANDTGAPAGSGGDGLDWHAILAALDRGGEGRSENGGWGVPGPGPSSSATAAHANANAHGQGQQVNVGTDHDLLTHLAHNLLQQQVYQGFSPEYVALLQQQLAAGAQLPPLQQRLQTLHGHQPHPPLLPSHHQLQTHQPHHQGHAHQPQRSDSRHSSQPGSARGSISGTASTTPSHTSTNTPIAPAPPTFSAAPSVAPTPSARPPLPAVAGPSAGLSTAAPTPGADDTEDKRVRNTLASARFRAKKKAHVENIERNIRALEAQHSELEVQVADLRKENGLLKDMVQLKYGGVKNG